MKFLRITFASLIFIVAFNNAKASNIKLGGDTALYKQVIDSLISIALRANQPRPIVWLAKMRRANDEIIGEIQLVPKFDGSFAIGPDERFLLGNDSLKSLLQKFTIIEYANSELTSIRTPAQISTRKNGWRAFKSFNHIKRLRKSKPDFFV